ncbi:MAG: tRNA 4-thiouridine(8) synthase ThiI [Lachnospiraceae bacterium]|nr:tRNA 4-thiouridine(8) synthase ThiI [Lachnospiraceae bacterium]
MRYKTFLLKYGEIALKGKNRHVFEDALVKQVRLSLKKTDGEFYVGKMQGRIYVDCEGEYDENEVIQALQRVFGLVGICPVVRFLREGYEKLSEDVLSYVKEKYGDRAFTFKVETRRALKTFPGNSMQISADLGGDILNVFPKTKVDIHKPEILLQVEIREDIYVYSEILKGAGGMPIGTGGRAMLLLSGGIDSPVAGYRIAKRGVEIEACYFHAPPYTTERAKQKVIDLAKILSRHIGRIKLYVVNFTDIQMTIYEKCPHNELTIIMRRYMMRIAEQFAIKDECLGLVTGESIGQVASQTMQSLLTTNAVCTLPVYRPLIGYDKSEIVEQAQEIDTFETSILPFEDCCTIFVAKHPVTKPMLKAIEKSEELIFQEMEAKAIEAIKTAEIIKIEM